MKIEIYTSYHKQYPIAQSDILFPIHVGKGCSDKDLGFQADNTGDNISLKNPYFCELTALYWIWKNVKADYVGLFHYRRYLDFKPNDIKMNKITGSFANQCGLNAKTLTPLLQKYDIILSKKSRATHKSLYNYYAEMHNITDLDITLDVIQKKYPHMTEIAETTLKHNSQGYFYNIMITSKPFFDTYMHWLFDILFEVEKQIQPDVLKRDDYQKRVYGFLSERLMTVYIEYKKQTEGIKILDVPCILIEEDKKKWRKFYLRQIKRKILTKLGLRKNTWNI